MRARATSSSRSLAWPCRGSASGPSLGMLSASQARARRRKLSTSSSVPGPVSMVLVSGISSSLSLHAKERGDPLPVLVGRAVHGPVDRGPPQVQVDVVLPGDTDAAVHLHAVLDDL